MRRLLIGGSHVQGQYPATKANDETCPEKPDHLTDVGDNLALGYQLFDSHELANDLLCCLPVAFHSVVLGPPLLHEGAHLSVADFQVPNQCY